MAGKNTVCGAKTKKGTPCQRRPMPNGRCYLHGGKTPKGPASPNYKHGRYSKYLPSGLVEAYQQAQNDPDLYTLRDEIHLLDVRIGTLVSRLDTGDSADQWGGVEDAYLNMIRAGQTKDMALLNEAIRTLGALVDGAKADRDQWSELGDLIDQRRKLVESERRRYEQMHQMITSERALLLVTTFVDIVRRHVDDRVALTKIAQDVRTLLD